MLRDEVINTRVRAKHFIAEEVKKNFGLLDFEVKLDRAEKVLIVANVVGEGGGCEDSWPNDSQCLIGMFRVPGTMQFSQFQVAGSPSMSLSIGTRIAHGMYKDGATFVKPDNWNSTTDRHHYMGSPWTGRIVLMPR